MFPVRVRALALLASLALATSCVDGDVVSADGEAPDFGASIAFAPVFPASDAMTAEPGVISRIRVTVVTVPGGSQLGTQVFEVSTTANSWDLDIQFELPNEGAAQVELLLELLSVTDGTEKVEWSGKSAPITVTGSTPSTVTGVPVGRGPLSNLGVTGISIDGDDALTLDEGTTAALSATATTTASAPPVVTWTSLNPAVATVGPNGLVTAVLPGTARIVAAAGTFADEVSVTVEAVPTEIRVQVTPDAVDRPGTEVTATGSVLDVRGNPVPGATVDFASANPALLAPAGGSTFEARGEGQIEVIGTSAQAPGLQGSDVVTIDFLEADLGISKAIDVTEVFVDDVFTYTVVVSNAGPETATSVLVQEEWDRDLALVSNGVTGGTFDAASGSWNIPSIAVNASETLTLAFRATEAVEGRTVVNTATLGSRDGAEFDPNPSNDTDDVSILVQGRRTDLTFQAARRTTGDLFETDTLRVRLTVTNDDDGAVARSVVAGITRSTGLTLVGNAPSRGSFTPATGSWTLGEMQRGQVAHLDLDYAIQAGTMRSDLKVEASLASVDGATDTDPSNDVASVTIRPLGIDIAVDKTVDRTAPFVLETLTYTITARNESARTAANVQIGEALPSGLTLRTATAEAGTYGEASGVWAIPTLPANTSRTLTITATVDAGTVGRDLNNTAIYRGSLQSDRDAGNDSKTVTVRPRARSTDVRLEVTRSRTDALAVGDPVEVSIIVHNDGPQELRYAFIDTRIPTGLEIRRVDAPAGIFTPGLNEWRVQNVAAGDSRTLLFELAPAQGTAGATLPIVTSVAEIDGSTDPNTANNSVTVPIEVLDGPRNAIARSYTTLGNTELTGGAVGPSGSFAVQDVGLLDGLGGGQVSSDEVGARVTQGGALLMVQADGGFSYLPPAGVAFVSDTFHYSVDDGPSAVVTIQIDEPVWWLDSNVSQSEPVTLVADAGNVEVESSYLGTSAVPFSQASEVSNYTSIGDVIFVVAGVEPYGPIFVQDDQTLIGEGVGLTTDATGEVVPPGPFPVFETDELDSGAAVQVLTGATVMGIEAASQGAAAPPAILGVEASGATFSDVRTTGTGTVNVDISYSTGPWIFDRFVVDDALGSFRVLGGDPQVEVDVALWQQPPDVNVQWAFQVWNSSGSLFVFGERLQLNNGGLYAYGNDTGFIEFDTTIEVVGGGGYGIYGNAFYLYDNQIPIYILGIDAQLAPQAYPLYAWGNDRVVLTDVRYQGSGNAVIQIYDTRLEATFSRLHYAEDGSEYAGNAVQLSSLRDGSRVSFPDLSIDAYGGSALYVGGTYGYGDLSDAGTSALMSEPDPTDLPTPDELRERHARPGPQARARAERPYPTEAERRAGAGIARAGMDPHAEPTTSGLRREEPQRSAVTVSDVVIEIPNPGLARLTTTSGYGYYGSALVAEDVVMDMHIGVLESIAGNSGVELYETTGSLVVDETEITDSQYTSVYVDSGDPQVELNVRPSTISSVGGGLVEVYGTQNADVVFRGGRMEHTGGWTGIYLWGNTGSRIVFDTQLDLQPGTYTTGIYGRQGGTLEILGADNTISTTYGRAIDIEDVEIGAGGLNFRRIDVMGDGTGSPSTGMRLQNTGMTGPFRVTGTGTTDGSGGVFDNLASGRSIALHNAHDVELTNMVLSGSHSIDAHAGTSGVELRNVQATGSSGPVFWFWGAGGSVVFDDVQSSGGSNGLLVQASGTENVDVSVQGSAFTSTDGGYGAFLFAEDDARVGARFESLYVDGVSAGGAGVGMRNIDNGSIEFSLRNSSILDSDYGVQFDDNSTAGSIVFDVRNSTFGNVGIAGIEILGGAGDIDGVILDNTIYGASAVNAIRGVADAESFESLTGEVNLLIQNNNIGPVAGDGIRLGPGYTPSLLGTANLHVLRNAVEGGYSGLVLENTGATMCFNVAGNMLTGNGEDPDGAFGFSSGATSLERVTGTGVASNVIRARFESESGDIDDVWSGSGTANGIANGGCTVPELLPDLGNIPPTVIPVDGGTSLGFVYDDLPVYAFDPDDASVTFTLGTFLPALANPAAVSDVKTFPKSLTLDFNTNVNGAGVFTQQIIATDGSGSQGVAELRLDIFSAGVIGRLLQSP